MEKTYCLKNLDCANCAAKMERKIQKIAGVNSASVNFMTQKLTIDGDENRWDAILEQAAKVCRKVEADCIIDL